MAFNIEETFVSAQKEIKAEYFQDLQNRKIGVFGKPVSEFG
jgi:hypothetical protein